MATACARCGAQNPDGNAFCSQCGAPLATVAVPPAATGPVPPTPPVPAGPPATAVQPAAVVPPAPFVYTPGQSPYLPPPPAGSRTAQRLSRNAIIAIISVAVLVVGGAGIAFAALHRGATTPSPIPPVLPTSAPVASPTGPPTGQPTFAPTPRPSGAPGGGGMTVDTPFATVLVPNGFTVTDQKSDFIQMTDAAHTGLLIVASDPFSAGDTNSQLDASLLQADQSQLDPNAAYCSNSTTESLSVLGSGGQIPADGTKICLNVTPQNGQAYQAVDAYLAGVAKASDGSLKSLIINIYAPADKVDQFANEIGMTPFFSTTTFKDATAP